MKSIKTQKHHRTENGRTTLCGIRITSYSDIVNKDGLAVPPRDAHFQFTPYKIDGPICEKCNKAFYSNK